MLFQLTFGACHAIGTQGEGEEGGKSKGSKVQKIVKDEILMVSLPSSARFAACCPFSVACLSLSAADMPPGCS